jgi:hypothetical protein
MGQAKPAATVPLPTGTERTRRVLMAMAARRKISGEPRFRGRAWINGREVGGVDPRYAHLSRSHD